MAGGIAHSVMVPNEVPKGPLKVGLYSKQATCKHFYPRTFCCAFPLQHFNIFLLLSDVLAIDYVDNDQDS